MSTVPPALSTASSSDEPSYFIDWPTLILAIGVYATFGIITLNYHAMPWWLVLPLGAMIVCLHGSLQHEATHGFPTRWERSEEHTSELQSQANHVCRLLLEKKKWRKSAFLCLQ